MAKWYKGIKKQMERHINAKKMDGPGAMDGSVNEIFHEHVKALCSAYARVNTADAAMRKLAIKALTLWRGKTAIGH
jgi:hypothetical protein